MSRKKAAKAKGAASSPSACSPGGKAAGKAARSSPGIVQMNGVVHPSRPSISSSSEFYDIAFKVMLVGDSGVGKTCLLVRFKDGAFLAGSFISTVGIDFRVTGQTKSGSQAHHEQKNIKDRYVARIGVTAGAPPWSQAWVGVGARRRAPGGRVFAHGTRLGLSPEMAT
ncbi:hypothetical protein L3Q82_002741 [Scortum barcoo]|uniref:Uncharacterized protein n=1 Tax=Scortum barcoo TaxID=214431 RepID=A0ACB8VUV2_9TELE|nr:hypothetical protein L3Q82_002741 [Scortum barcoo]